MSTSSTATLHQRTGSPPSFSASLREVPVEHVEVLDEYEANAFALTVDYLLRLEPDRFLHPFFDQAGLPPRTESGYGGWESATGPRFQGHFFGHYISALAQAYATSGGLVAAALLTKLDTAVNGLHECQLAYASTHPTNAGYISAFPIEALPTGNDGLIVPFYNLHKLLAGLLHAHRFAPAPLSETALVVAAQFGSWVEVWVNDHGDPKAILATEYGGMNDALYQLYALTADPAHRRAAERFDETDLFDSLASGIDVLDGLHANTTIPKLLGALKRYSLITDDPTLAVDRSNVDRYRHAAENFWSIVTSHHTYANGGNSQAEHFHRPGSLHQHATNGVTTGYGENSTSEGCNEYNMLKLTRELFLLSGDVRYADYYESTLINAILASQNPVTGMVTYFQPMAAGYAKVFGRELDEFWCDQGTALESFTKLGDSIYFTDADGIRVTQFRASVVESPSRNLRLIQTADVPRTDIATFAIEAIDGGEIADDTVLRLRVPGWVDGRPSLSVNGEPREVGELIEDSWIRLTIRAGDRIDYRLPAAIKMVNDTEDPNWVAFRYGPVLLATELSRENVDSTYEAGVLVRMSATTGLDADVYVSDPPTWKAAPHRSIERLDDGPNRNGLETMQFQLLDVDQRALSWTLEPYFSLHGARYAAYFTLRNSSSTPLPQSAISGP